MKMIKNIIEYLIAISVIPAIILTVLHVTELKDVKNVQYELLSEEDGIYHITPGTYNKLVEYKKIKNYDIESNYPLITHEEMDRATWVLGDVKNEIYIDENGEKRIIERVVKITFDGNENWINRTGSVTDDGVHVIYDLTVTLRPGIKFSNYKQNLFEKSSVTPGGVSEAYENGEGVYLIDLGQRENIRIYITIKRTTLGTLTINEFLSQNPLTITYEAQVEQDRPVEVYDFSKFRLTYDKNRIRVVFDLDDGYYLWEITNDDKMIPINGQYDLGNIWTVKFYVYEIQQPLIRTLVLLIPLIIISGVLLYMYNIIKKKGIPY